MFEMATKSGASQPPLEGGKEGQKPGRPAKSIVLAPMKSGGIPNVPQPREETATSHPVQSVALSLPSQNHPSQHPSVKELSQHVDPAQNVNNGQGPNVTSVSVQ